MKVAYILNTPNAANYKVGTMILPQLEEDRHGVEVLGIFFFAHHFSQSDFLRSCIAPQQRQS